MSQPARASSRAIGGEPEGCSPANSPNRNGEEFRLLITVHGATRLWARRRIARVGASDVVGGLVLRMTSSLRSAGVPVSTGEAVDAALALEASSMSNPALVRAAMRSTLVKRQNDVETFERTFDAVVMAQTTASRKSVSTVGAPAAASEGGGASTLLLEELLAALQRDDASALSVLAGQAVDELAGIGFGARDSERAFLYRVLRGLDLARLLQQAIRDHTGDPDESEIERAIAAGELEARVEAFRRELAVEIRRRLGERGTVDPQRSSHQNPQDPMDISILSATPRELDLMRRTLRPLARRLAVRGRRRSRFTHRGRLDMRRTIRRSLSTGGLPLQPMWRRPRTTRPELVILCDVSGSVAEFARFTLALMSAMSAEFSALRCFAFVDGIDEVTRIVDEADGLLTPGHILARTNVIWRDGHSDFGRVLDQFASRFPDALTPRATVLIAGDARNNHRSPNAEGFANIARRVREVHWLNPEQRRRWDTGDSAMSAYSRACSSVHEVRTLRQLEAAVEQIEAGVQTTH